MDLKINFHDWFTNVKSTYLQQQELSFHDIISKHFDYLKPYTEEVWNYHSKFEANPEKEGNHYMFSRLIIPDDIHAQNSSALFCFLLKQCPFYANATKVECDRDEDVIEYWIWFTV